MPPINKNIFSQFPIDFNGAIWEQLERLEFNSRTSIPKDILCFLENGVIRKYCVDTRPEEEQELCVDFYFSGDIFTAKADDDLSRQFIYAPIGKGILWYIGMDEVRQMFFESKLCSATQKVFVDQQLRDKAIREMQLLRNSPVEMYRNLLLEKPRYIQQVPLKYLASYIGITPQALSRIRRRIN